MHPLLWGMCGQACACVHGGVINELEAVEEEVQVLLGRVLPALGLLGKIL